MRQLAIVFSLLCAGSAVAQDHELREAAQAYVETEVQQVQLDNALPVEGIINQLNSQSEELGPERLQELTDIIQSEVATLRTNMEAAMIDQLTQRFSIEEIKALTAFYETPDGASAMLKLSPFIAATQQQMQPAYQQAQQNIRIRIAEVMSAQE